jgi:hypothetical protein
LFKEWYGPQMSFFAVLIPRRGHIMKAKSELLSGRAQDC